MYYEHLYPVLEFDDNKVAKINPEHIRKSMFSGDKLIITFFPEVLQRLLKDGEIRQERIIPGENPFPIYEYTDGSGILITLGQVGCPACGGDLDLFHSMGIRKVLFCGGGGVLKKDIDVGTIVLIDGAIRDEGFSYHYIPAGRIIYANPAVNAKIANYLNEKEVPFLRGLTWTTDAIFRETPERIARRREEGALVVEMEQAACLAVSEFRQFSYGALIYGGDDCASEEWSNRGWRSRNGIRFDMVSLCKGMIDKI